MSAQHEPREPGTGALALPLSSGRLEHAHGASRRIRERVAHEGIRTRLHEPSFEDGPPAYRYAHRLDAFERMRERAIEIDAIEDRADDVKGRGAIGARVHDVHPDPLADTHGPR